MVYCFGEGARLGRRGSGVSAAHGGGAEEIVSKSPGPLGEEVKAEQVQSSSGDETFLSFAISAALELPWRGKEKGAVKKRLARRQEKRRKKGETGKRANEQVSRVGRKEGQLLDSDRASQPRHCRGQGDLEERNKAAGAGKKEQRGRKASRGPVAMVRATLAAARRALQRLLCSAPAAAAHDDGKGGSDDEEGGKSDSWPRVDEALENDGGNEDAHHHHHHHHHGNHHRQHDNSNNNNSNGEHIHGPESSRRAATMRGRVANKENIDPAVTDVAGVTAALGQLKLARPRGKLVKALFSSSKSLAAEGPVVHESPEVVREREQNLHFIGEALDMARLALRTNETPVGCVLVHKGQMIAKGMNATNVTRNGTRHAELMAISALLSVTSTTGPRTTSLRPKQASSSDDSSSVDSLSAPPDEGNEDGSKGHLYPYGQKLHPSARVDRRILHDTVLYVTVEPCVMCASLLRQFGIKKVYFGAVNDKFGGTGGVFSIHANSLPASPDGCPTASAHPMAPPRRPQLPDSSGTLGTSYPPGGGDGGNVERGYEIEGGWGRDDAVGLLRRFYVQENGRAPVPRKKEGRAARLAAMISKDDDVPADEEEEAVGADEADEATRAETTRAETTKAEATRADGQSAASSGKENRAPVDDDDDSGADECTSSSSSSSGDDDVDHEFYLGLAQRSRRRTYAL